MDMGRNPRLSNICLFLGSGSLRAVFAAAPLAVVDASAVQRAAHDVIAHTGQVLDTTTAHQNDAVLLEVVTFAGDVRSHFNSVGQTYTSHLTQSRIRLLWRGGTHLGADAALLGVAHLHATGAARKRILRKA